jgi:thiamine biosynthesis lipoprotein
VYAAVFAAMASPCELLVETTDRALAARLGGIVADEARRIEAKFSRYRPDSVVSALNRSAGRPLALDAESTSLVAFAARCHALSAGAFDITSGVLRKAWRFDGSNRVPSAAEVSALRAQVGFERLRWAPPQLAVPEGMEIDFGGIGKEYAVDCALALAARAFPGALLVNFGGDLAASGPTTSGPWAVGVERPGTERETRLVLDLSRGALATSGDSRRFIERDGVRYGHILDVHTGWPVTGAPRSVTVAAASCIEAGMLATLAMLKGAGAEAFLEEQGVEHWCLR